MSNKYIRTNVDGLVKDPKSNAVLSVDHNGLAAYKRQKQFFNKATDTSRIETVENEISEIKQMLQVLLEKLDIK